MTESYSRVDLGQAAQACPCQTCPVLPVACGRGSRKHRLLLALAVLAGIAVAGCGQEPGTGNLADARPLADAPDGGFACPTDGVRGSGRHRLFLQGHQAAPDATGVYSMLHEWAQNGDDALLCNDSVFVEDTNLDGVWQPGEAPRPLGPSQLVHGEHFLVGPGAFVEFSQVLCDDITGEMAFYIPNFDVAGSQALHQLFVVHGGQELLIAEAIDTEAGQSGYNPFVRVLSGNDPPAVPGDRLLLRSTNLNGLQFSVMIWFPPSEYESWVLVNVP